MLRFINLLWTIIIISILSGCAPQRTYQYTPPSGKTSLACISSCKVALNSCMQICGLKNSSCRSEQQSNATERYTKYKMQRQAKGLPVQKKYDAFLRTSSCEHSCNCVPAYNTCYRACGGMVI